jgi:hypothetical protein
VNAGPTVLAHVSRRTAGDFDEGAALWQQVLPCALLSSRDREFTAMSEFRLSSQKFADRLRQVLTLGVYRLV